MVNSNDLSLVIGILLMVLAIPPLLNAWTSEQPPRFGAIIGLTGLVLVGLAVARAPGGTDIPAAFHRVFRAFFG